MCINDCGAGAQRKTGECNSCYRKRLRSAGGCKIEDCENGPVGKGLCSKHWQRQKAGLPMDYEKPAGRTYISPDGYVVEHIMGHIQADKNGKVLQHRRVFSDMIGRRLESFENVHHINGVRSDNREENLELWITRQPAGQRVSDLVSWAKWVLENYE